MDTISNLVHRLSQDSFNYLLNYNVAQKYLELNQTASAVSFFLRCAEYGADIEEAKPYVYSSLLAIAKCFDTQSGREYSVTNTLLQAIAFDDSRPEAYYFLANYYERAGQWQECYTFAKIGHGWQYENKPLPIDLGYVPYGCEFEMAIAAYWIGRKSESLERFKKLQTLDLTPTYKTIIKENLEKLNALL